MKAPSVARCAGVGGHSATLPAKASTAPRRSSGSSAQPIRQPVIPQYFENDDTVTLLRSNDHAQVPRPVAADPSAG